MSRNARHYLRVPGHWAPVLIAVVLGTVTAARPPDRDVVMPSGSPADLILASLPGGTVRDLAAEVLARNPDLAGQDAFARAAARRGTQAGALPDPFVSVTGYAEGPETRVGPQTALISLSQRFPWFGRRALKRAAADREADGARAAVEAARLRLVTQVRSLAYEMGFLNEYEEIVREDRATLAHYEEVARARYTSGVGLEQAVVKIQAEITKADARLLEIRTRRAALLAQLNALRDRPDATSIDIPAIPAYRELPVDFAILRDRAIQARPEADGALARINRSDAMLELARKENSPDLTVGLSYGFVGEREDAAGRTAPPADNGQDVLGISLGVNLPVWRNRVSAGIEEAVLQRAGAEDGHRAVIAAIDRSLGDLQQRIPLTWNRVRLFEDVLVVQARQSLLSAESGYAAGSMNALELLDAERVLLESRIAMARARADYAQAAAELEGAVGEPVFGP